MKADLCSCCSHVSHDKAHMLNGYLSQGFKLKHFYGTLDGILPLGSLCHLVFKLLGFHYL